MLLPRPLIVLLLSSLPLSAQQAATAKAAALKPQIAAMAAQVASVSTPDFTGKTIAEVNALNIVPGTRTPIFAGVVQQGETTGMVVSQSPAPGTPVYPGRSRLAITLARKPTLIDQIVQQIINQPRRATVPDVRNHTLADATKILHAAHLNPVTTGDTSALVAQQNPLPGESVSLNSKVELTFIVPQAIVPSLYGLTLNAAQAALERAYLRPGTITGDQGGDVTTQSIQPGTQIPRGTAVSFGFRAAASPPDEGHTTPQQPPDETGVIPQPQQVFVPSLAKLTREQAIDALTAVDLVAEPAGKTEGLVSNQKPAAGTAVLTGSTVAFALAIPMVTVPSVIGDPQSNAEARLAVFGLSAVVHNSPDLKPGATHLVIAQSPAANVEVATSTAVTITIGNAAGLPPPPPRLQPWVLPSAAVLLGLLGFGAWKLAHRPATDNTQKHHEVASGFALTSQQAPSRIATKQPPAIRFTITLHNRRHTTERYSITREPTATRKG